MKRNYLLMGGLAAAALGVWWKKRRQMSGSEESVDYCAVIYRNTPVPYSHS